MYFYKQMHPRKDGCSVAKDKDRRPVVKEGIGILYKSFGAISHKICNSNLQQNDEFQVSTYSHRQSRYLKLPLENRGTKIQEPQTVSKEI